MRNVKTVSWSAWFGFLLMVLWMTSCAPRKSMISSTATKDSTYVTKTKTIKDSTIVIPANRVEVSANIDELSTKPITKTSKNLTASLSKVGNTVIAYCDQEKLELIIKLQSELIEKYQLLEKVSSSLVTVPEPYIPWWAKTFMWVGISAIVALIIYICIKLF